MYYRYRGEDGDAADHILFGFVLLIVVCLLLFAAVLVLW
jgi:hypothetical protein